MNKVVIAGVLALAFAANPALAQNGGRATPADSIPTPAVTKPTTAMKITPEDARRRQAASERRQKAAETGEPDVLVDVPNLSVQEITLKVKNLRARVTLDARLANLVQITAGADATIDEVDLQIKGVQAEALLKVRLDNVASVLEKALDTIDKNPKVLDNLPPFPDRPASAPGGGGGALPMGSIERTADSSDSRTATPASQSGGSRAVGPVSFTSSPQPDGLLSVYTNPSGRTVQRLVDTTGTLLERTLDPNGVVVGQRTVGDVTNLKTLSESTNATGQTVRRVADSSGAVLEITLDSANKLVATRVLVQATGGKAR